jgi:hypothetical protein
MSREWISRKDRRWQMRCDLDGCSTRSEAFDRAPELAVFVERGWFVASKYGDRCPQCVAAGLLPEGVERLTAAELELVAAPENSPFTDYLQSAGDRTSVRDAFAAGALSVEPQLSARGNEVRLKVEEIRLLLSRISELETEADHGATALAARDEKTACLALSNFADKLPTLVERVHGPDEMVARAILLARREGRAGPAATTTPLHAHDEDVREAALTVFADRLEDHEFDFEDTDQILAAICGMAREAQPIS